MLSFLGCMAERLKEKILDKEKLVDLVAGPGKRYAMHFGQRTEEKVTLSSEDCSKRYVEVHSRPVVSSTA